MRFDDCTCDEDHDPHCPQHLSCDCRAFRRERCVAHGARWLVLIDGRPENEPRPFREARQYAAAVAKMQDLATVRLVHVHDYVPRAGRG